MSSSKDCSENAAMQILVATDLEKRNKSITFIYALVCIVVLCILNSVLSHLIIMFSKLIS